MVSRPRCHLGWLSEEPAPSLQFGFHCCQLLHSISLLRVPVPLCDGKRQLIHIFLPPEQCWNGIFLPLKRKETAGVCPPQEALAESCFVKICLVLLPPRTGLGRKLNLPPTFYLPEIIYSLLGGGYRGLLTNSQHCGLASCRDLCSFLLTGAGSFCPNPFLSRAVPAVVPAGSVGKQPGLKVEQLPPARSLEFPSVVPVNQLAKLGHSQVVLSLLP